MILWTCMSMRMWNQRKWTSETHRPHIILDAWIKLTKVLLTIVYACVTRCVHVFKWISVEQIPWHGVPHRCKRNFNCDHVTSISRISHRIHTIHKVVINTLLTQTNHLPCPSNLFGPTRLFDMRFLVKEVGIPFFGHPLWERELFHDITINKCSKHL